MNVMSEAFVIRPAIFASIPGVRASMSTRHGGVSPQPLGMNLSLNVGDDESNVRRNRSLFLGTLGRGEQETAFAGQCHSATVMKVERAGLHPSCDALYTRQKGIVLAVSIADCVPILLANRKGTAIAAVHAGWRGSKQRILVNAIGRLRQELSVAPADLLAFIGPSAGPCCYEVGPDVSALFHDGTVHVSATRTTLDLKQENRRQLELAGVPPGQIEVDDRCTICGEEVFHSFRRDGVRSGRMLAAITMM